MAGTTIFSDSKEYLAQQANLASLNQRFSNKFSPLDDGLIISELTNDANQNLQIARVNQTAIAATVARVRSAKAAGMSRPQIVFPNGPVPIVIKPFPGTATPKSGVSAVGGGHYLGSALNLTGGWSAHGVVVDQLSGFDIISEGCRFLRLENDPYNSETVNDALHSTLMITRCKDFCLKDEFYEEGYQVGFASAYGSQGEGPTSGNFIDISYGCVDFDIRALVQHWKGSNTLAIGLNRAAGFSTVNGISGYDTLQPCLRFGVDTVHGVVGEHALFINMADQWSVQKVRKTTKAYTYKGVAQDRYSQRGIYLQGCGTGVIRHAEIYDVWKAGMFIGLYDTRRSYKDLDVRIDDLFVQAATNQDDNYHSAMEFFNHNLDPNYLRCGKVDIGMFKARGVKTGFVQRDDGVDALKQSTVLKRLSIAQIDIIATGNGIVTNPTGQDSNITLGDGEITVLADSTYSATAQPVQGLLIGSAAATAASGLNTAMTTNVRIGNLTVTSANRAVTFSGISGLVINGLVANYVEANVPNARNKPLSINFCTKYGGIDYRTSDGNIAAQDNVLEVAPNPMRGMWSRSYTQNPGTIPAGQETAKNVRALTGLRASHLPFATMAHIDNITVRVEYDSDNNAAVYYRNTGTSDVTPGPISTIIGAIATQTSGT